MIRYKKKIALLVISTFMLGTGVALMYATEMCDESFLEQAWGSQCGSYYPCKSMGSCGFSQGNGSCHQTAPLECAGDCGYSCDGSVDDEYCGQTSQEEGCQVRGYPLCGDVYEYECVWGTNGCGCENPKDSGTNCVMQICW